MEQVAEHGPQELRLRMRALAQPAELLRRILRLEDLDHLVGGLAVGGPVVLLLQVQHQDVLAGLAEHARAGLLAERALGDQRLEPFGRLEVLVPGVVGQGIGHGLDDMAHGVEADHVRSAVGGGLRTADQRAGQRVDLVEAQPRLGGVVGGGEDREHADPVADEVGRVLGVDHALAQRAGQEGLQPLQDRRLGGARRDQLGQVHVTRRVEEVHPTEPRAQFFWKNLRQLVDSEARRIAGQHRVRRNEGGDLAVQVLLPVHPLGDRLDDEVAVAQLLQLGLVVGRGDGFGQRAARQRGGAELGQASQRLENHAVGVALLGRQLEQHGVDPGIGQVRGDLRAHDAGPQYRGTPYKQFLRHVLYPFVTKGNPAQAWKPAAQKRISSWAALRRCVASLTPGGRLIRPKSAMA